MSSNSKLSAQSRADTSFGTYVSSFEDISIRHQSTFPVLPYEDEEPECDLDRHIKEVKAEKRHQLYLDSIRKELKIGAYRNHSVFAKTAELEEKAETPLLKRHQTIQRVNNFTLFRPHSNKELL